MVGRSFSYSNSFKESEENLNAQIGSGPFKFKEWKANDKLFLVKNNEYDIKNIPLLEKIEFKLFLQSWPWQILNLVMLMQFLKFQYQMLKGLRIDQISILLYIKQ